MKTNYKELISYGICGGARDWVREKYDRTALMYARDPEIKKNIK